MNLLEQDKVVKQDSKAKRMVLFAIVFLVVLLIVIIVAIAIINQLMKGEEKLSVDGKSVKMPSSMVYKDNETNNIYIQISTAAYYAGYDFYNGEYNKFTEDRTKCYVENKNQVVSFEANAKTIYKNTLSTAGSTSQTGVITNTISNTTGTSSQAANNTTNNTTSGTSVRGYVTNTEEYEIENPIKIIDNKLYATPEAIAKALNIYIAYSAETRTLNIQTLEYLQSYYKSAVVSYGYTTIAEDFESQKSLSYGMIIVIKDGTYGVINANTFATIIGTKYDKITFIESTQEFLATSEGKQGVLSNVGETRIALRYDRIGTLESRLGLYYAINDNLIGVLNRTGKVIVFLEYENLGVNRTVFNLDSLENNLILYENCIPLQKENKWGMADKDGNTILNFEYDQLRICKYNTKR